jgi:hypothetical protein
LGVFYAEFEVLPPEATLGVLLDADEVVADHELELVVQRGELPLGVDEHEGAVGRVEVSEQKLAVLEDERAVFGSHEVFLESDVARRTATNGDGGCIVDVDDVLLHLALGVVTVTHHDERRVHHTLRVKHIPLALVHGRTAESLLTDLTTQIVLEVLKAV